MSDSQVVDVDGNPLKPGTYEVRHRGIALLAYVTEDEHCDLLCRLAGSDRMQRVDEIGNHCEWRPCQQQATTN